MKVTFLTASLLALLFAFSTQTFAANFIVTRADDRNATCNSGVDCSIREAIAAAAAAAGDDTINFVAALQGGTITLATGELVIGANGLVSITGFTTNPVTITANNTSRVLRLPTGTAASVAGIILTGGNSVSVVNNGNGGAINNEGTLELINVWVKDNSADFTGGGIIHSQTATGTLTIRNSTVSGNVSRGPSNGGGIQINSATTTTIINTTISGNRTGNVGGGIRKSPFATGTLNLTGVTIVENTAAADGGGLSNAAGTVNIGNSIVALNTDTDDGANPDAVGSFVSQGYNLIGNVGTATGFTNGVNGDQIGGGANPVINPMLGPLTTANGGPTPTHALMTGSSAIDKGKSFGATTDQRGLTRPVDNSSILNATNGDSADIGAFEVQMNPTAAFVSVGGRVTTAAGRGLRNARVTLIGANGETRTVLTGTFGYYRFVDVPAGGTYVFSVSAKRYTFSQQTQVGNITEDTDEINFKADN